MEILFKNSYTRNKEMAKEFYRYYYFQRRWLEYLSYRDDIWYATNIEVYDYVKAYDSLVIFMLKESSK